MSDPHPNILPRKALIAVAALIGFSLLLVVAARLSGYNASQVADSPAVVSRDLRFVDGPDGVLLVLDAAQGSQLAVLPSGNAGFIRGVLRAMERDRHARHVDRDTPYRLARLADGRLTLRDLGTKRVLELSSFGPTNVGAFAEFLTGGGQPPVAAGDARPASAGPIGATH